MNESAGYANDSRTTSYTTPPSASGYALSRAPLSRSSSIESNSSFIPLSRLNSGIPEESGPSSLKADSKDAALTLGADSTTRVRTGEAGAPSSSPMKTRQRKTCSKWFSGIMSTVQPWCDHQPALPTLGNSFLTNSIQVTGSGLPKQKAPEEAQQFNVSMDAWGSR
jgi:hypothetical protein